MKKLKKLYKEMLERYEYLESLETTADIESRKNEMNLAIVRIQQLLLKGLKKKR